MLDSGEKHQTFLWGVAKRPEMGDHTGTVWLALDLALYAFVAVLAAVGLYSLPPLRSLRPQYVGARVRRVCLCLRMLADPRSMGLRDRMG